VSVHDPLARKGRPGDPLLQGPVVERVLEAVGLGGAAAVEGDLQVQDDVLGPLALPIVDADDRPKAEVLDADDHGRVLT